MGEISSALEGVYGRYQATVRSISGVYAGEWEGDGGLDRIRTDIAAFAEEEGRRPRLMVVKMGQDGHDRGAKVIATAFADLGFDVDIGPLFQTPQEAARAAIDAIAAGALTGVSRIFALHCDPRLEVGKVAVRLGPITSAAGFFSVVSRRSTSG